MVHAFFHIYTPNSVPVPIITYGTLHLLVLELKSLWDERKSNWPSMKVSCFFFKILLRFSKMGNKLEVKNSFTKEFSPQTTFNDPCQWLLWDVILSNYIYLPKLLSPRTEEIPAKLSGFSLPQYNTNIRSHNCGGCGFKCIPSFITSIINNTFTFR